MVKRYRAIEDFSFCGIHIRMNTVWKLKHYDETNGFYVLLHDVYDYVWIAVNEKIFNTCFKEVVER